MRPLPEEPSRKDLENQADIAQLVERLIRNQKVAGSSPAVGSISFLSSSCIFNFRFVVAAFARGEPQKLGKIGVSN